MARKKKVTLISVKDWCSCSGWKEYEWRMMNHHLMVYCAFCGKKLVKEKTS